jgi:hypothetical protein
MIATATHPKALNLRELRALRGYVQYRWMSVCPTLMTCSALSNDLDHPRSVLNHFTTRVVKYDQTILLCIELLEEEKVYFTPTCCDKWKMLASHGRGRIHCRHRSPWFPNCGQYSSSGWYAPSLAWTRLRWITPNPWAISTLQKWVWARRAIGISYTPTRSAPTARV